MEEREGESERERAKERVKERERKRRSGTWTQAGKAIIHLPVLLQDGFAIGTPPLNVPA